MAYFITKKASKWAQSNDCTDPILVSAIHEMERGLVGNALGSCLYKKRVAIPGTGKSGGWRIIIATKLQEHWFVIHGFAKNVQENIDDEFLGVLRQTSKALLSFSPEDISCAMSQGLIRKLSENF